MYNFKFQLEDKDYIEFNKFYLLKYSKHGKRQLLVFRICTCLLLVVISAFFFNSHLLFSILLLVGAVVVVILSKWFYTKQIEKQVGKIKKEGKLPYGKNVKLIFRNTDFDQTSEQGKINSNYNALEAVVCGDDGAVYLFNSAMSGFIIPARAFESPQQLHEFMEFMEFVMALST